MSYYKEQKDMNNAINTMIEGQHTIPIKNLYAYAYLKFGAGANKVDKLIEALETIGKVVVEAGVVKSTSRKPEEYKEKYSPEVEKIIGEAK